MHSLEIIILRNARAAGRELAHLDTDEERSAIHRVTELVSSPEFAKGYAQGLRDDEIAEGTFDRSWKRAFANARERWSKG